MFGDGFEQSTILRTGPDGLTRVITRTSWDRRESVLVEAYEDEHDPLDEAGGSPQSVVGFMLEQRGLTRADLHQAMGGKARVSEFFAGKRRLSIEQIRALRDLLHIPADLLIG